jgi:hypothetical protein
MTIWEEGKRRQISELYADEATAAHRFIAFARLMSDGSEPADLRLLLSSYVNGACSSADHLQVEFRGVIDKVGVRAGFLPPRGSFFDDSHGVRRNILSFLCPELESSLYTARDNSDLEHIPLLEACPNELASSGVPPPMNMLLHRPTRPAMRAYATRDAALYAYPFRYQVLTKDQTGLWTSGSPRALSRAAIGRPEVVAVRGDIIVLQDRFTFSNFAHFLFDGITRLLLLAERLGGFGSSVLVFGGVPGDYQSAVCHAVTKVLGLGNLNIYFPDRPIVLETPERCIWFSDQVETYIHPAQMAHPISIDLLRRVVEAMPAVACGSGRIYVSRSDAQQRRVANEPEISTELEKRGFRTVQLSRLSVAEQIGVFRDADIVVGPHGMGLTHLVAADRLRGVVELFTPNRGTDAYAFIAKAGQIDYTCLIGEPVDGQTSDFAVDARQVMQCVDILSTSTSRPSWHRQAEAAPSPAPASGCRVADYRR